MTLSPGVKRSITLLVLVYGVMVAGALIFEEKLIYFPQRELELTPSALGLRFEEVSLVAEDGVRIHGWLLPAAGSHFTVLIFHGNAGNISHRLDRVLMMRAQLAVDVLLFDYRGFGKSEGSPNEQGTYRDGRAAYRFLAHERQIAADRIVLFGESLGAAVALDVALGATAAGLVLESPFTSIADMARAVYPFLPISRWVRNRYDNATKIARLEMPVLIFHGRQDKTVPFTQGRRLFEHAGEPKRFVEIPTAGHNDVFLLGGDAYWRAWRELLDSRKNEHPPTPDHLGKS